MREIKFRGFDTRINKMYPYVRLTWNGSIEGRMVDNDPNSISDLTINHQGGTFNDYAEEYIKIMQFTGLLDKQGREIYEGDIVRGWWNNYHGDFAIVWDEGAFGIALEKEYCPCLYEVFPDRNFEVIGNFYENPDLLAT